MSSISGCQKRQKPKTRRGKAEGGGGEVNVGPLERMPRNLTVLMGSPLWAGLTGALGRDAFGSGYPVLLVLVLVLVLANSLYA